jgi:hypothetical protein
MTRLIGTGKEQKTRMERNPRGQDMQPSVEQVTTSFQPEAHHSGESV